MSLPAHILPLHSRAALLRWAIAVLLLSTTGFAQEGHSLDTVTPVMALVSDRQPEAAPIHVSADLAQQWDEGGTTVLLLRGRCQIRQGATVLTGREAVVWWSVQSRGEQQQDSLQVYLEGDSLETSKLKRRSAPTLLRKLVTTGGVHLEGRAPVAIADRHAPLYTRAEKRRNRSRERLTQTQLIVPDEVPPQPGQPIEQFQPFPPGPSGGSPQFFAPGRRVSVVPRDIELPYVIRTRISEQTTPPELVVTVSRGVNIVIEGVPVDIGGTTMYQTIDLTADRAVIWTDPSLVDPSQIGSFEIGPNTPLQIYLEGNIVVRQGDNIAWASRVFYDIREDRGLLLDAELRVFVEQIASDLRVRAGAIRQLSADRFHAQNAWLTTSRFGRPGYRIEASDVFLERLEGAGWPWLSQGNIDPLTGQPDTSFYNVNAFNARLYLDEYPVLFVPRISGPAEDPQIPIRRFALQQDSIFGFQVRTEWDAEALTGLQAPPGWDWRLQLQYLSERGPAIGTTTIYRSTAFLNGYQSPYFGESNLYYVHDDGRDNLGLGRRSLEPEQNNRGRATWRHRQYLPYNTWIDAELGFLSDRNFLEQYFEREWDEDKDHETYIEINNQHDNVTLSGKAQVQLNDFANTTEWLPRGDLTVLGQPLLGGWLNWSSHTSAGYGDLEPADAPNIPGDPFTPLPYFADVEGGVLMSRHELSAPFSLGPVKVNPYVLGEAAHWQEALDGTELSRLYGSAGVRGSLEFWKPMPFVRSRIFGLNGLAHKMVFDFDYHYDEASENLSEVAQYNPFDDNAQERFRERFPLFLFPMAGGAIPAEYDPRFYAVRDGAGRNVTDPYHELVDDLHVLTFGWRHRLQTKYGPPDRLRIKDWMTLDLEASYFPQPDRDNFGEDFGLFKARYAWNVGERTSFVAGATYDVFDLGQEIWHVGLLTQRSLRGSLYLGFRQVAAGPLDSQILTASYTYAMSPKWISTAGTAFDISEGEDRGTSLTVSRLGEWFILHLGLGYDRSKDNFGVGISFEPRFGPTTGTPTQLSSLLGIGR